MINGDPKKAVLGTDGFAADGWSLPPARRIATDEARRLGEFDLHYATLLQAAESLEFLAELLNGKFEVADARRSALANTIYEGVTINYCRCFDPTRRDGNSLDASLILVGKPMGQRAHESLMTLRSKHIAHDVNGYRDVRVAFVPSFDGEDFVLDRRTFKMNPDHSTVANLFRLVRDALAYVKAEQSRLETVVRSQVQAMTPAERASSPIDFYADPGVLSAKASRQRR